VRVVRCSKREPVSCVSDLVGRLVLRAVEQPAAV